MKKIFISLGLVTVVIMSCSKDSESSIAPTPTPSPTPSTGTKVTYNANAKAVFDNNCISCHPGQGQTPFNSYTTTKNNITNILTRIQSSGASVMPPTGKMSQANIDIIKQWQVDGLLEN